MQTVKDPKNAHFKFLFGSFLHVEIITHKLVPNFRLFEESLMVAYFDFLIKKSCDFC